MIISESLRTQGALFSSSVPPCYPFGSSRGRKSKSYQKPCDFLIVDSLHATRRVLLSEKTTTNYDNSDDSAEEESAKPDLDLAKPIKPDLVLTNIKDLFSAEYFDKKNLEGILPKPFVETEKPPETTMAHFYPPGLGPPRPENGWPFCPTGAPLPNNEAFRLEVLKRYNLLDTPPDPKFDRLTQLAAQMFKAPVALISLVETGRQWFKANVGLPGTCFTDRAHSFCAFTLLPSKDPCLIVEDAFLDSRFSQNKLVLDAPFIRFYAGAPLVTKGGFILGSFCIIDFKPREFSEDEKEMLCSLAQFVMMEIEKHASFEESRARQALKFEADKRSLLNAIDAFTEGLVVVDTELPGQPIVFVNEGWEKITGYSTEEVLGMHCGSLLQGPLTSRSAVQTIKDACMKGQPAQVEMLNYRKDGTPFWNWLRIRPVETQGYPFHLQGSEKCRLYFGILSDCTERKEKELQLERIKMEEIEKEAAIRAKRKFLANISHEIRTPMNAIIACSQLLQDSLNLSSEHKELVQTISGAGDQLLALINDILDFSKLDAGKMALHTKEFNVWNCLDFCMEMLVLKSQSKGLDLSYNVDPSVPHWIWADEVRLGQILINLLSNAAKFTEEGGEVEVSVVARRRVVSSEPQKGQLPQAYQKLPLFEIEFSVRDTGVGMPPDFVKVIFDAFTQCEQARKRKHEGTGLGMAIAKELTELMGGRIWVESELGFGSTFFFTVLVHGSMVETKGGLVTSRTALSLEPTLLTGKRALLVGPSESFERMVGSILRSWGMLYTVVKSTGELVSACCDTLLTVTSREKSPESPIRTSAIGSRKHRYDVVLVDFPVVPVRHSSDQQEELTSLVETQESSLYLTQMGCGLSQTLPTFLLLAQNCKQQSAIAATKMPNTAVLSRPVRVKQLYKSLLSALISDKNVVEASLKILPDAPVSPCGGDLRILIAEDNFVNQRVLLKLLKGLGFEDCVTAVNGLKVLEQMRAKQFDVVLMDVQMPEMDGLTATSHIRTEFLPEDQPIIAALTADVGGGIEHECQSAGMNWYLSKPITKAELKRLLDTCSILLSQQEKKQGAYREWLKT